MQLRSILYLHWGENNIFAINGLEWEMMYNNV